MDRGMALNAISCMGSVHIECSTGVYDFEGHFDSIIIIVL